MTECWQQDMELVSRCRTEWLQQLEQAIREEQAHRQAEATPRGPPEKQPLEWRSLDRLDNDKDFLLPQAPDDDPCPIDMSTPLHSASENHKHMAWIRVPAMECNNAINRRGCRTRKKEFVRGSGRERQDGSE